MEGITNELIINALSQDTESINNEFMAQVASSGMESMIATCNSYYGGDCRYKLYLIGNRICKDISESKY